jgi:hypothetical protein
MIAIHHRHESFSNNFSNKWIEYCEKENIQYKIVNCYDSDIISHLDDCDGLMWHWAHYDYKAALFARQLTYSLEQIGKFVFPNRPTCWHFDDKVGQKYFLEAIGAPLVPTYVFYDKEQALQWISKTMFPKVFKLSGGAGSENVRLVKNKNYACKLIKTGFSKGFKAKNRINFLKERIWQFKRDRDIGSFLNISKGFARLIIPTETEKKFNPEKNYVYFQDFIPQNDYDIRIIVIGKRAFAIKRMVRKGDFRASGSGNIKYEPSEMPVGCVKIAFEITERIRAQCLAYDFVFSNGKPLITEISYGFARRVYLPCPGYWTEKLEWIAGNFFPEYFMIEDFIHNMNDATR